LLILRRPTLKSWPRSQTQLACGQKGVRPALTCRPLSVFITCQTGPPWLVVLGGRTLVFGTGEFSQCGWHFLLKALQRPHAPSVIPTTHNNCPVPGVCMVSLEILCRQRHATWTLRDVGASSRSRGYSFDDDSSRTWFTSRLFTASGTGNAWPNGRAASGCSRLLPGSVATRENCILLGLTSFSPLGHISISLPHRKLLAHPLGGRICAYQPLCIPALLTNASSVLVQQGSPWPGGLYMKQDTPLDHEKPVCSLSVPNFLILQVAAESPITSPVAPVSHLRTAHATRSRSCRTTALGRNPPHIPQ
jgi:hypothetical protein